MNYNEISGLMGYLIATNNSILLLNGVREYFKEFLPSQWQKLCGCRGVCFRLFLPVLI